MPSRPNRQQKKSCLDDRASGYEKMKPPLQKPAGQPRHGEYEQQEGRTEHELVEIGRHPGFGALGWRRV
jgi:hypothetical protein